jgi:AcrR family transcriptional regulator
MQGWIPVPGSAKARLIEAATHHFERADFEAVNVTELAAKAGVTTGAPYHHFGSKLGLYTVIRGDLEQRITDHMEGAATASASTGARPSGPPCWSPLTQQSGSMPAACWVSRLPTTGRTRSKAPCARCFPSTSRVLPRCSQRPGGPPC